MVLIWFYLLHTLVILEEKTKQITPVREVKKTKLV